MDAATRNALLWTVSLLTVLALSVATAVGR